MVKRIYHFIDRKLGFKELCRYGSVGLIGASIDFTLLNLLVQFTPFDIYYSIVIAFISSVIVSYFLHCSWTFRVSTGVNRLLVYSFTSVFGLILNVLVMYYFMEHLNWWYNYAKVAALVIVVGWNYFVSKALIFKSRNN
ncbi:MAG: hypothetical protein UT02_C0045G0002 [Parcubacteria group bacterium GW2011_GWC2_38_7]|nr:MAG: hypothetical protein UT02_C0045G0002 [Parcubacteria group bacterium GW2011_GWC2_38_7]